MEIEKSQKKAILLPKGSFHTTCCSNCPNGEDQTDEDHKGKYWCNLHHYWTNPWDSCSEMNP